MGSKSSKPDLKITEEQHDAIARTALRAAYAEVEAELKKDDWDTDGAGLSILRAFAAAERAEDEARAALKKENPDKFVYLELDIGHIVATACECATGKFDIEDYHPYSRATMWAGLYMCAIRGMEAEAEVQAIMDWDTSYWAMYASDVIGRLKK